ncbi:transglycosylase family protein [Actinacidiphila sp. bgisy167]|uniref:transglycosylase family protein n=1 Tax=Actinacidiphila sp. bgisy167 TaxID=3413797 RepID=UPI003D722847
MLKSGNGRHRKPRQAPAAVVAVAATGAGLTLPLFAAGGASAADANSTWNAVALCESGGLWSSNTGNGFYGGLQITEETWQQYGGRQYAERPDLASRNEQITVAEKILAELGPDAWSSCAESSGLIGAVDDLLHGGDGTGDGAGDGDGTGDGDQGAGDSTGAPTSGSTDDSTGTGDDTTADTTAPAAGDDTTTPAAGDGTGTATPDADPTEGPVGTVTPSAGDQAKGPGKHRKPDAGAPHGAETGTVRVDPATGSAGEQRHDRAGLPTHFVEGDAAWGVIHLAPDTHEDAGKAGDGRGTASAASARSSTGGHYLVREGDSLSEIAAEQHVTGGWRGLYDANRDVIGDDPNLISPGSSLVLGR